MCTVLLPPGVNPIAVNKYIINTTWDFVALTVDVTLCLWVYDAQHSEGSSRGLVPHIPEDGGNTILQYIRNHTPDDTQPRTEPGSSVADTADGC